MEQWLQRDQQVAAHTHGCLRWRCACTARSYVSAETSWLCHVCVSGPAGWPWTPHPHTDLSEMTIKNMSVPSHQNIIQQNSEFNGFLLKKTAETTTSKLEHTERYWAMSLPMGVSSKKVLPLRLAPCDTSSSAKGIWKNTNSKLCWWLRKNKQLGCAYQLHASCCVFFTWPQHAAAWRGCHPSESLRSTRAPPSSSSSAACT